MDSERSCRRKRWEKVGNEWREDRGCSELSKLRWFAIAILLN